MSALEQIMERDGLFVPCASDFFTPGDRPLAALRRYAIGRGHKARTGGWIYNSLGNPICQGWFNYAALGVRNGWFRQDMEMRVVARANRAKKLRNAAAHRRELAADESKCKPLSWGMAERWEREAREYDAKADEVLAMPVVTP